MALPRPLAVPLGWIARHLVLVTVLVFILVGYDYREAIFGIPQTQRDEAGGEETVRPSAGRDTSDAETMAAGRPLPQVPGVLEEGGAVDEKAEEATTSSPPNGGEVQEPPVETAPEGPSEIPADGKVVAPPAAAPLPKQAGAAMGQDAATESMLASSPVDEAGPAAGEQVPMAREIAHLPVAMPVDDYRFRPLEPLSEASAKEDAAAFERLRQEARRAYWNGDPATSERLYMALLEKVPDDADLYGELGNVRYQSGDLPGAVTAYRQAVRLLRPVDPERARRLEQRIRLIQPASPRSGDRTETEQNNEN